MTHKCKFLCLLVIGTFGLAGASADIMVTLDPSYVDVADGVGGTATADIVADIPEEDAILGWGLDLLVADPGIAAITNVAIGGLFNPAYAWDGDDLAGLAFPECVWGEDVLLATVTFTGLANGECALVLGDDYPDDLTEGFALCGTGFAEVIYGDGWIIVPEPASLALLAVGLLALRRR